jgi:hypothetical protein
MKTATRIERIEIQAGKPPVVRVTMSDGRFDVAQVIGDGKFRLMAARPRISMEEWAEAKRLSECGTKAYRVPKRDAAEVRAELTAKLDALTAERQTAWDSDNLPRAGALTGDIAEVKAALAKLDAQPRPAPSDESLAVAEWIDRGGFDEDDNEMLDGLRRREAK